AMLAQRLSRYRLRARVAIAPTDMAVAVAWGGAPGAEPGAAPAGLPPGGIAAPDPRLPEAGWRLLCPAPPPATATPEDWQRHRLSLGLPDGSRDLEAEKTVLLEAGFDELNGVSWTKGCYMGQELTARTRYRGLLKRRLVPVAIDGPPPAPGTPILRGSAEVGTLRFADGGAGMAVLRLEALDEAALSCGSAVLHPRVPAWMRKPEAAP
ncbi:MAG: folate-binding protein, partial [Proteobacteria bacterium]|nr:folate-binding protein [Pseudomonadota bacterium]